MQAPRQPSEEQRDQAALWLAKRAGGSMSASDEAALESWLAADAGNAAAFEEAEALWQKLERPSRRLAREGEATRRPSAPAARLNGWPLRAIAAAAAALLCIWLFDPGLLQNWRADVVSGHDTVTQVILPDGSLAKIGADTALAFHFDDQKRHVDLLRGEAYFEVIPGSTPPFTVDADGDQIRVVGTGFNVVRANATTTVTVAHGKVAVRGVHDGRVVLEPGTAVRVASGIADEAAPANVEAALSWMEGRLTVEQVTLGDLAARFERQAGGHILLAGKLADRRVSGTFPLDDVAGSLETIAAALGAHLVQVTPWVTILY